MRYWWVNQNQTFRHEFAGKYLWSPKRKADGTRNPFYESMREVSPGDLVFCFVETRIRAFGLATSYAYECPKPVEFGSVGRNWEQVGWRVDVSFQTLPNPLRPSDRMDVLRALLPEKYAPLQASGHGVQSIYLTELPKPLALALADLIGGEIKALARVELAAERELTTPGAETLLWEEHLRKKIEDDRALPETDREALVIARRGQGLFRERVQQVERCCRVTRVSRAEHLRASHCKPWRDSSNEERLDGENGLLLTPSIDHLFDRGFISFEATGRLLVSPVAHKPSLSRMGVPADADFNVGAFTTRQAGFLEYHRDQVFLCRRTG
ncbi:MAG: HNH endonuclease [Planctomycetes bacterium]|nr:HNH endonuclease [Planctomycetota bacterium]